MPRMASLRSKVALGLSRLQGAHRKLRLFADMILCEKAFELCILQANINHQVMNSKLNRLRVLHSPPAELTKKFMAVLAHYYPQQQPDIINMKRVLTSKFRTLYRYPYPDS